MNKNITCQPSFRKLNSKVTLKTILTGTLPLSCGKISLWEQPSQGEDKQQQESSGRCV